MTIQKSPENRIFQEGLPPARDAGLFGLVNSYDESQLLILPVTWDATASYGKGAANAPKGIAQASHQLDLEDLRFGRPYEQGIFMLDLGDEMLELNTLASSYVQMVRARQEGQQETQACTDKVNEISAQINSAVEAAAMMHLSKGKSLGVLGGDHSAPFGLIKALASKYTDFGILHIDAHFDLRKAYEGFRFSHASIMYNVLESIPQVAKLVQVGIRDFCAFEKTEQQRQGSRVDVFYDGDLYRKKAAGQTFKDLAHQIVAKLPEQVYISFDIDGLDPSNCPGTGTPVPGGLSFHEACYLMEVLAFSGKKIIGFDLCEVAGHGGDSEWDYNVGARVLYKICGALLHNLP